MFINTRWLNPWFDWADVVLSKPIIPQDYFNNLKGSSAFKYSENNEGITYEISVPGNINEDAIEVSIKDGVLTLNLPKVVDPPKDDTTKLKVKFQ